jgi:crossover junction endodeoxyribonuclease RuvC
MIVLGVDPGSRVTGYGFISVQGSRLKCLDYGAVKVGDSGRLPAMPERLKGIYDKLHALMDQFSPDVVAVEGVFYAVNVRSALTLGHVRGVVFLAAAEFGLPLVEFSPLEIKKAVVGYGRADKKQVQLMVKRLLGLSVEPEPHDASDALAVALCQAFNGSVGGRKQRRWRASEVVESSR